MTEVGSVLHKEILRGLIGGTPPLIEGFLDLDSQLQPNGVDLTLRSVAALTSPGLLGQFPSERELSQLETIPFGDEGYTFLSPGPYLITLNEVINLPLDVMALGRARSTLLRCGVALHTAVWDAGYSGRSQSLLVVYNPQGFRIGCNSRVLQLVFLRLAGKTPHGYGGIYQGENL